jgi:hypothetical protein
MASDVAARNNARMPAGYPAVHCTTSGGLSRTGPTRRLAAGLAARRIAGYTPRCDGTTQGWV